jgi:nucleoside-diphosphate-sugar epimerase
MNILVTGATGFFGSRLSRELLRKGHQVFGLSQRGKTENTTSIANENKFHLIISDIRDAALMQRIIKENRIKSIFHLAAQLPEKNDNPTDFDYFDTNARGTLNLLDAAAREKVSNFIYGSTISVYSGPPVRLPVDENHPTQPTSIYAVSKLTGELLCNAYAGRLKTAVLRYSGAYGSGERESDAVWRFMRQARKNQPLTVYGDGKQTSDYVFIEDVIRGTALVLEKDCSGVYNIGSGEETSVITMAEKILKLTGSKSKISFTGNKTDRPFRFYLDIDRAKKDFGYTARPLDEGLRNYLRELDSQEKTS